VALGLHPARALLNDVNPHLINFYRCLQGGLRTDLPMANDETLFYQHRQAFNDLVSAGRAESPEAAALFYYLNRTGFNGLCRFNKQGTFNVPFGRYARIRYIRDFTSYQRTFAGWTIGCGDFEAIPKEPGDFVYADPPYDVEFTQYSSGGFPWEEQVRVAQWLSRHPGPVILVNQGTERVERLYRSLGFSVRFLTAPRRISCTGDRAPAREILASRHL
jgi:DNA adenine methylase